MIESAYRWVFENLRIVFPLACLGGIYQAGNICWNTCKQLGLF